MLQNTMSLSEFIAHGQMEARHKVRLWVDLLRVLGAKHREGFFYGTLSPSSILIDHKHNLLLFESPLDRGSPYLAPEVRAGEPPGEQSDIYSMGVILFELLTGSLKGLHRHPPSRLAPDVPRWLDAIVLRCVMERRSQRYLDLGEVEEAFRSVRPAT